MDVNVLDSVLQKVVVYCVAHLLVWGGLAIFYGPQESVRKIQRFYMWVGKLFDPVARAVALSLGFLVVAMAFVLVFGIVRFS